MTVYFIWLSLQATIETLKDLTHQEHLCEFPCIQRHNVRVGEHQSDLMKKSYPNDYTVMITHQTYEQQLSSNTHLSSHQPLPDEAAACQNV